MTTQTESLSDKLVDRKKTFIEDKNLNDDQQEAIEDFVTWLTFRIDYGDREV